MSLRAFTRVKRSESTGSLDSYCGKFVDDILLHLSFEKQKSKSPTLVEEKNLTYTIADEKNLTYTIERSYSTSSGRSVCVKLVDEVFHLSTLEKEPSPTPLPSISSRNENQRKSILDVTPPLTPDEMEIAAIAAQSRSSSGLSNYCENFVDKLLFRISIEKEPDELEHVPIPVSRSKSGLSIYCDNFVDKLLLRISLEKDETPPLTPDEMEVDPIAESFSRSSSGLSSYCGKVVDDLLLHISVEKESVSLVPTEKDPVEESGPIYTPVSSQSFCSSSRSSSRSSTSSSSSSSSRSSNISGFCDKLVDDLLIRIRVEKVKSVSPIPIKREQTPYHNMDKTLPLTPDEMEILPIAAQSRSSSGLSNYCENFVDKLLFRISIEKESVSPTSIKREQTPPLTPDEMEIAAIAAQSRSSSGLSNYCENFVDKLLFRISIEKESVSPTSIKREQTPPLTPDEMEIAAIAAQSRSSSGLSNYCENFVDKLLFRISIEKESVSPTSIKREQTPPLTPDEMEIAPIAAQSRCSSRLSNYCETFVDGLLFRISIEKKPTPILREPYPDEKRVSSTASPIESEPTPASLIIDIPESPLQVEKRSYSRSSGKDLCIKIVDEAFILSTVEKEKPISDKTPCLTPDELEHVPIAVSRSSSGVSIYCDNFVDKLLLRISLEKDETPPLTPDEMEVAPIAESFSRSSSGLSSYCGKVVDDLLLHISVEKESVSPVPTEKYPVEEFGPIYTPVSSQSFCSSSRSITSSSSSSSSRSSNISGFCDKLVDDLLIRIRVEKVKSVSPPPSEKDSSPVERLPTPVETARQHSSRSLDSYCGRYVDDMLVRITVEKSPSPTEGDQAPSPSSSSRSSTLSTPTASHRSSSSRSLDSFCGKFVDKLLLRISVDKVPNQRSLSSSSGKSFCVNLMDGVVFQSTAEKETNPSSPADLSSVRSPVKEESSSSSSPSAGDPSTPYLPHTPAPTPTETTAQLASSRSYSRSSGKSYCVKLVDEVFHLSTVEAAKSITPIPIEREQTPYYAASPSPSVKEPTPAPAEPTPSPLKEPTPSPTEPTPSPITIEKDLVPPIEKQYVIRESDRDDTATTSFVSGIAHSICLQDQFVEGAESDSESCASYTRTPEIWKLTPLPPVQSARSPTPSVKSVGEKSPSEGTSPPPSTVVVSAPASPREATVVMSSNSPSEQQEPSDSSYVSASRDAIASPASDGALSDDEYQAYAESAYSDDFASDDEVQKSKTSSPSPLLASSPSPLFFNRTPTVVRTPEEEEEESKSPAPSPLFIKRSPPVIRTPTEEEAKRERMDREKTAPAGLEREVRVWQPLPPPSPSPSRLSVGTPARHSAGSLKPLSLNKLKAGMNQWRIPPKSSNRYLRRRVKIELDPESPYIIHHVDKQIAVQLAQDEMDSTRNEDRLHDFMKYKRKFNKMSQKKRIEELSEQEVRKTEITNSVYLGGKTNMNNRLLPLPSPPRSPPSSDSAPSPDEKEGFDSEKDAGLLKILDQIRNLTNASIGEMKTYNAPPLDVHAVVKCVYTILGENPRRLDHWQECVVLLSKLGRKHVRKRVLRMRKDRVTPEMREEVKKLLAGWTSYDIAQRSRVCVLFFIWCKEICDLNESPEDNPLLPIVMGRFMNKRNNNSVMSKIFSQNLGSGRNSTNPEILPGEESRRMVIAAARAFRMNRAKRRNNVLPSVSHTPSASRTPA
ncbi:mucin-17-like isoform X2 [Bolinopsis microptera]|uniref:mucin-17-like isoform X2 n=1 Tax=Bolinopsis microptera TaxID=2820187 RepID=UPI003079EE1E